MLVQDELGKNQVNCGATESEKTESIMIKSCYVSLSYLNNLNKFKCTNSFRGEKFERYIFSHFPLTLIY